VLVGQDAVDAGLIDVVGGVGPALETLHDMVDATRPLRRPRHRQPRRGRRVNTAAAPGAGTTPAATGELS
jgi:hypothetical protein